MELCACRGWGLQASKITLGQVTEKNVGAFRILNNSVLPVQYNDKFYADLVGTPHDFTKMGTTCLRVVGGFIIVKAAGCRVGGLVGE